MLDPQAVPGLPCTRHRSLRPPASLRTTPSTGAPCARGAAMVQVSSQVSNTGCRIAAVLPLQASTFIAPAHVLVPMCLTATAEPARKPCPALALDPARDRATVSGPTDITQSCESSCCCLWACLVPPQNAPNSCWLGAGRRSTATALHPPPGTSLPGGARWQLHRASGRLLSALLLGQSRRPKYNPKLRR